MIDQETRKWAIIVACCYGAAWFVWSCVDPWQAIGAGSLLVLTIAAFAVGAVTGYWFESKAYRRKVANREARKDKGRMRRKAYALHGDWHASVCCIDGHDICGGNLGELLLHDCPHCEPGDDDKFERCINVTEPSWRP